MPRPPKKPSKQDLAEIEMLAGIGLTQQEIADVKGICVETLVKYAPVALRRGKSKGIGKVARKCFEMASSGNHPAMTRFFLRTQAGWREQHALPEELVAYLRKEEE